MLRDGRHAARATSAPPTSREPASGSRRSPSSSSRASSPSWGRSRTRDPFASDPSTGSRSGCSDRRSCSCFPRPRRRTPPSRGKSGFAGSRHCTISCPERTPLCTRRACDRSRRTRDLFSSASSSGAAPAGQEPADRAGQSLQRFVIGVRRSRPNAFGRSFTPGGAWRRLYSARSTSATARSTTAGSNSSSSSSRDRSSST